MPFLNAVKYPTYLVLLSCICINSNTHADALRVAVASNFRQAGAEIFQAFEAKEKIEVKASYGSSGKFVTLISQGAPFDLFLAADSASISILASQALIEPDSRQIYAQGQLAWWQPGSQSMVDNNLYFQALSDANIPIVALANPSTAPYGQAALQALSELQRRGMSVQKTLTAQSVSQAFQFVSSGNADAGFVALSQLKARQIPPQQWHLVPSEWYSPLIQEAVILRGHSPAAQRLLHFLQSDQAAKAMLDLGYRLPHKQNAVSSHD